MRKKTTTRNWITDSILTNKGRKALMRTSGLVHGMTVRSLLTEQLYATLETEDAYVTIPLHGKRTAQTTVFNLKQKAARLKGCQLRYVIEEDRTKVHAWLERTPTTPKRPTPPAALVNGSTSAAV